jgi:hypothetical protein
MEQVYEQNVQRERQLTLLKQAEIHEQQDMSVQMVPHLEINVLQAHLLMQAKQIVILELQVG